MSEAVIYTGHGIGTADGKGRFSLPLDMRKAVKSSSGEGKFCLTLHPDLPCAIGFGVSHKHWLENDIIDRQRAARERPTTRADEKRSVRMMDAETPGIREIPGVSRVPGPGVRPRGRRLR